MIGASIPVVLVLMSTPSRGAAPQPVLGLDFTPFPRVIEGTGTGVGVGEGRIDPALNPWVGAIGGRWAAMGSVGVAWTSTSVSSDGGRSLVRMAAIRPGVDTRWYLSEREPGTATAYVGLGLDAVLPFVQDRSDGYSEEEQAAMDAVSVETRSSIRSLGARTGLGAEIEFDTGFLVGLVGRIGVRRGTELDGDLQRRTWDVDTGGALTLGLIF